MSKGAMSMKRKLTVMFCLALAWIPLVGCNGDKAKITIRRADVEELAAVKAFELARADYRFRLKALITRYKQIGNMQKQVWAQRELKNLIDAQTIEFYGFGTVVAPDTAALDQAGEAMLVELVVEARKAYSEAASELLGYYDKRRDDRKVALMSKMFDRFDPVRTYLYYLSAEIPASTLVASEDIAAADEVFDSALKAYRVSISHLKFGDDVYQARRRALGAFRGLVQDYPKSTRIGRSAYFIAEIYRAVGEPARAVVWYDRAFQWDAAIVHPARYRAAILYDYNEQVRDRAKARVYYAMAIKYEKGYERNAAHARKRIKELSPDGT